MLAANVQSFCYADNWFHPP